MENCFTYFINKQKNNCYIGHIRTFRSSIHSLPIHSDFIFFYRYIMFLLGNKFYIIFISLWFFGIYFIFTKLHSTSNNDKVFEDQIEYLKNEVESLKQKLSQLQSEK